MGHPPTNPIALHRKMMVIRRFEERDGAFSESLNLAGLWKLPAVFIVENNGVAIRTKVHLANAGPNLLEHGRGYAMPCVEVDGNVVEAVMATFAEACARARAGEGPTYIVANTYRFRGSIMSDGLQYRTREEVEKARLRDPITLYRQLLFDRGLLEQPAFDRLQEKLACEVAEAIRAANESPQPPIEARWDHVLAERYP